MTEVRTRVSRRPWIGPLALCLGLLLAHWLFSVPKAPMIDKDEDDGREASAAARVGGREAAAFVGEREDKGFVATHQPALEAAVDMAHALVVEVRGADPQRSEVDSRLECRRWRCQIELCGTRPAVRAHAQVLRKMRLEDDSLWDAFELGKVRAQESEDDDAVCQSMTLRFSRPAPELKGIRVDKASADSLRRKPKKKKRKRPKAPRKGGSGGESG